MAAATAGGSARDAGPLSARATGAVEAAGPRRSAPRERRKAAAPVTAASASAMAIPRNVVEDDTERRGCERRSPAVFVVAWC